MSALASVLPSVFGALLETEVRFVRGLLCDGAGTL